MDTKQKLFNISVNRMLEQGKKSENFNQTCRLRVGGLSCAVGILISDEYYEEDLETYHLEHPDRDVYTAVESSQLVDLDKGAEYMLCRLQKCHDRTYEDGEHTWSHNLLFKVSSVAKELGLNMNSIEWELTEPTGEHK